MEAPRMNKETLKTMLDDPGTAIIDVRREPTSGKIPGAEILIHAENALKLPKCIVKSVNSTFGIGGFQMGSG
jgi:hypothetical protein